MKTSTDTVYRRDYRLNWFRNGAYTKTVPEHVLKLAANPNMAIECSITVPAKKQRRAQKLKCQCGRPNIIECDMHGPTE